MFVIQHLANIITMVYNEEDELTLFSLVRKKDRNFYREKQEAAEIEREKEREKEAEIEKKPRIQKKKLSELN